MRPWCSAHPWACRAVVPSQVLSSYACLTTSTADLVSPMLKVCGSSSWLIAFTLCLPYVWRLCQCIRVYRDTGARPQLFNALKYSTAFPVIILSSMKYHVPIGQWHSAYKPLWLLSACLNSGYSYYWDIERDWEISFFSSSSSKCLCLHVASVHVPYVWVFMSLRKQIGIAQNICSPLSSSACLCIEQDAPAALPTSCMWACLLCLRQTAAAMMSPCTCCPADAAGPVLRLCGVLQMRK